MQLYLGSNVPKYMEDFVVFAMKHLGLDKLRGNLHFTLARANLEEESFGLCWGDRGEVEMHIASRQWGSPVDREDKLKTIAHEMTHAHQYFVGHLVPGEQEDFESTWLGEKITYEPENEHLTPWEVEASEVENRIYERWLNRRKK